MNIFGRPNKLNDARYEQLILILNSQAKVLSSMQNYIIATHSAVEDMVIKKAPAVGKQKYPVYVVKSVRDPFTLGEWSLIYLPPIQFDVIKLPQRHVDTSILRYLDGAGGLENVLITVKEISDAAGRVTFWTMTPFENDLDSSTEGGDDYDD